jgi:hypothetical protein
VNPAPTECEQELLSAGVSKPDIRKYWQVFFSIFSQSEANRKYEFEEIAAHFSLNKSTVSGKLKKYLQFYPEHIDKLIGFYPSVDAIIDLAIRRIGEFTPDNVFAVNMACKEIVDSITRPKHDAFISSSLRDMGALHGNQVNLKYQQLADFMYDDYSEFLTGSDNGRVSIAGRMNEEILLRALAAAGLERNKEFIRTGTDSEADIQLYHHGRRNITLYCEVKSYKARERFLRGLRDIPHSDKIGAGFFLDAAEFNPTRTSKLLETTPKAIYLPQQTWERLHVDSLASTTHQGNRLYRPLERFAIDMVYFVKNGELPAFRF